jgi:hypothetical protein
MTMRRILFFPFLLPLVSGCGQRDEAWDAPLGGGPEVSVHAMSGAAALVDVYADRVIFASPETEDSLALTQAPIDHGYAASVPTTGGDKLVVLTRGDVPRRRADDQGPSLTVLDTKVSPPSATRYDLADPLSGLAMDPRSEFALVYPSTADSSFVQNPNELVLIKLTEPPSSTNPVPTTLRSFGGRPEGFTFTPDLSLPGGKSRLLVVRTDRDVALIDLAAPEKPEITVKLSAGADSPHPVGVAVSDGEADDPNDARVAVRLENDSSVILLDLLPTPADKAGTSPHAFLPAPNIIDVGGVPADIAFGKTDGGLRMLATVPSKSALVLVEPATGVATSVALGAPFDHLSIVTEIVGETAKGSDVALLWSTQSPSVAFVALGSTVGKPYKAVERLSLDRPIEAVIDVPAPNENLKILVTNGGTSFVVLNLLARTASPLNANVSGTQVLPSADGQRLWMFAPGSDALALVNVENLHPQNLLLNYPVTRTFDLARKDGGRAALALHGVGSMAFTLLDGKAPSVDKSTEYLGILLGDYQ